MDRNSLIGFALLILLASAYIWLNNSSQKQFEAKKYADSVAYARAHPMAAMDSTRLKARETAVLADTNGNAALAALPAAYRPAATKNVTLENKSLSLQISSHGGTPVAALLKDFKTYDGKPLYLFNGNANTLSALIPGPKGNETTGELYFTPIQESPQKVDMMADLGNGKKVDIIYSLPADGYMMDCNVKLTNIAASSLPLTWEVQTLHTERDINNERQLSQVHYRLKNKDHDYWTIKPDGLQKSPTEVPLQWLGVRMHYFSSALITEDGFTKTDINGTVKMADSNVVAQNITKFEVPVKGDGTTALRWYIGPNHYKTLKSYDIGMEELVPLGSGLFFFVKYINMWMIIPIFDFLTGFIGNYGVIIMLLTLFIKLILSFFTYKSYLSGAKMRVLKPELDQLRAKFGDDQQKMGVEQMKMYREAGVSPLGGCLPTLFMMPFLVAMYYFFPAAIELRQKSFLWAHDLSTYDSIARLPFSFFDHISLFTLLMTASSLALALYNRNMTPQDPNNPLMKYMPFIFPFVLLGVFNKMAAALTFYYFFSNMISLGQQFVIQKFFINEKKIHAQMQENRNKPATPSKWQQKIEEMQKTQQERVKQVPRSSKK